ncbi:hypothetical protein Q4I28_006476 [Leishmania naiffi]|uniref:Uncharacterized protein n=1 Tax=Leishmania naiffi TaxID=5678 RepID=A0AAW3BDX2_9TRYP
MPSEESRRCHCRVSDRRRYGPPPNRPPCCCEKQCTCTYCSRGGPTPPPQPALAQNSSQSARASGAPRGSRTSHVDTTVHVEPHLFRRCLVCVPEQAELKEADLLALQQRCGEARVADQRWRSGRACLLGSRGHRGGGRNFYQSNTAEMLRRQRNSFYQQALNDEHMARRRALQTELDARRDEIIEMQRARETLRMEAAFRNAREARQCSCGTRACPHQRACSTDPAARASLSTPPLQRKEQLPSPPSDSKRSDRAALASTQPKVECVAPTPPQPPPTHPVREASAPQQHRPSQWNYGTAPWGTCCTDYHHPCAHGQWHYGWIWCPSLACNGQNPYPSLCSQARPLSFPLKSQAPPLLPHDAKPTSDQASPTTEGDAVCGHAKRSAADSVSMISAGKVGKSLERLERDTAAGVPSNPPQRSSALSATGADCGAAYRVGKDFSEREREESSRFHSHSGSSVSLTAPRFGRKVFVTDDIYCDRRARYLAEWEACGAVQRIPTTSRSPSAPLTEKTPRWRTTGGDACAA